MLGSSMLLIGNSVLANLNKENASVDNLGLPFWRLVISSGIVVIVMGAVNIAAVSHFPTLLPPQFPILLTSQTELHIPQQTSQRDRETSPIRRRRSTQQSGT